MKTETRADVQARVATMFARLDTNHDGFITQVEIDALQAQRAQRMEQRAAKFDPSKIFDRLDLNHDGQITTAEAEAARSQRAAGKGRQAGQGERRGVRRPVRPRRHEQGWRDHAGRIRRDGPADEGPDGAGPT